MSNSVEQHPPARLESTLDRWIHQTIGSNHWRVKFHCRGNNLHILCEGEPCPDRLAILRLLVAALRETDLASLLPADHPQIYQVQLYGCQTGRTQPTWMTAVYLNQLDRHWEQIQWEQAQFEQSRESQQEHKDIETRQDTEISSPRVSDPRVSDPKVSSSEPGDSCSARSTTPPSSTTVEPDPAKHQVERFALALSNRSLARQGQETAIASYLSETLSKLGVAVRVNVKSITFSANSNVYSTDIALNLPVAKRLWIACEAPYSPDPSLLGEPVSQKLRDLEIEGYRDAVILFQVAGENNPDWLLRVDLTPPEEMLREWARWGDVEAVQRLLNQSIAHLGVQFPTASLKEQTLHLFCEVMAGAPLEQQSGVPDQHAIKAEITPILEMLAPQGIHAATVYGQVVNQDTPAWVDWLELPASQHPALAESAIALAQQEDWAAIAFLLQRLLNPSLDDYLATGGVRLQLLPKQDLLHVMSEAAVCPDQRHVGYEIARFLKPLKLPSITGVRVYGRRAGQKHPIWSYGVDFSVRDRIVPEATPEFAVTDAYVNELIAKPGETIFRPDLTPADLQSVWQNLSQQWLQRLQQFLVRSQLFIANEGSEATALALPNQVNYQGMKLAAVWSVVGVLVTVQVNWLMGNYLRLAARSTTTQSVAPVAASPEPATTAVSSTTPIDTEEPSEFSLPEIDLPRSPETDDDTFVSDEFTSPATSPEPGSATPPVSATISTPRLELLYTPQDAEANLKLAETLAAESQLPSFNSRQLNDKLTLYYRVIEESGVPDVLIIGSSRALRGVDPTALKQALAELGYSDVQVFNLGINGATAQVIDLLITQLLTPEQLPRLIVWADGARAFNSNGTDVTYNGITASPAFQQFKQGTLALPQVPSGSGKTTTPVAQSPEGLNRSLTDSYQALDRWLSQQLGRASKTYGQRDRLKQLLQDGLTRFFPDTSTPGVAPPPDGLAPADALNLPSNYELVDLNGFLSLGIQFNPATYYQKYAKVPGAYDRDYSDFQIPGVQENALRTLLQHTQTHQVPVVFVNLPMTDEYLDPARMEYEQQFRDYMVNFSLQQPGFIFRDLGELWPTQYDYFSDPSHLNRYGAYAVSHKLAQDPLIPWVQPDQKSDQQSSDVNSDSQD